VEITIRHVCHTSIPPLSLFSHTFLLLFEDPERARLDDGDTLRLYSLVDSGTKRRG
jgi:hypothetical protein